MTGDFGHIDPTAKKLINPEISLPKIAITQTTISQKLTESPIVVGTREKTKEVQAIEKETGIDFFSGLDDKQENQFEGSISIDKWDFK